MIKITLIMLSFFVVSCATHRESSTYSYKLINDGTQKMKACQLQCQSLEAQCKQLAATKYQTAVMRSSNLLVQDFIRDSQTSRCEYELRDCFKNTCGGEVKLIKDQ